MWPSGGPLNLALTLALALALALAVILSLTLTPTRDCWDVPEKLLVAQRRSCCGEMQSQSGRDEMQSQSCRDELHNQSLLCEMYKHNCCELHAQQLGGTPGYAGVQEAAQP